MSTSAHKKVRAEERSSRKKKGRAGKERYIMGVHESVDNNNTPACRARGGGSMGGGGRPMGPMGGGGRPMGPMAGGRPMGGGGHWGPGWKPGKWGPGWNPSFSGSWGPGWGYSWGAWPGWQKWAAWQPEYYNNYLYDYPVNVSYKCQPQCELDCNTENPSQGLYCSNSCQEYCTRSYPKPPSCSAYCFENCYKPGQSMDTTCNHMCQGNPKCLEVCTHPPAASGFNSCQRACKEQCL